MIPKLSCILRSIFSFYVIVSMSSLQSEGKTVGLHFPDYCAEYRVKDLSGDVSYVISWSGEKMDSVNCTIGFTPPNREINYSESVCFDPISYIVKNCNIRLVFSQEGVSESKNYSCNKKPRKWCANKGSLAKMELLGANNRSSDKSHFQILVMVPRTNFLLFLQIGIILGLTALFIAGIVMTICWKRRRKEDKIMCLEYTQLKDD